MICAFGSTPAYSIAFVSCGSMTGIALLNCGATFDGAPLIGGDATIVAWYCGADQERTDRRRLVRP
ncbi:MAG: hypothetical protein U0992_23175 [Planctomycetaceae bacterium]